MKDKLDGNCATEDLAMGREKVEVQVKEQAKGLTSEFRRTPAKRGAFLNSNSARQPGDDSPGTQHLAGGSDQADPYVECFANSG